MENRYFPMFVDISRKKITIIGGGKIAARRAVVLSRFADDITVIAPDFCEKLKILETEKKVQLILRTFEEQDILYSDMVITATNDHCVNARVGELCQDWQIPVNVADDRSLCDFYFPGIVIDEDVVIGISAGGNDPGKVKQVRKTLEEYLLKK